MATGGVSITQWHVIFHRKLFTTKSINEWTKSRWRHLPFLVADGPIGWIFWLKKNWTISGMSNEWNKKINEKNVPRCNFCCLRRRRMMDDVGAAADSATSDASGRGSGTAWSVVFRTAVTWLVHFHLSRLVVWSCCHPTSNGRPAARRPHKRIKVSHQSAEKVGRRQSSSLTALCVVRLFIRPPSKREGGRRHSKLMSQSEIGARCS